MTRLVGHARIVRHAELPATPSAEQIMAMPVQDVSRRWTAREVRQLTADNPLLAPRYELVDGELLVTPSPGRAHQAAVLQLVVALHAYLEREPVGEVSFSPSDVELEPESVVQPDLFVVPPAEHRRLLAEEFPVHEVMLAIEVLSPSSGRHDRVTKRPLYLRHVAEYWIVDTDARLIERWTPGDARPEVVAGQFRWNPPGAALPFELDLVAFFARVMGEA